MRVDFNSDVGEGFGRWSLGDDEGLLKIVTSANVACGFHAGDPSIMRRVCAVAAAFGVAIGAQVGYRDLAGFGRRRIEIEPDELAADLAYQIGALDVFARAAGSRVTYLKPHGALYNTAVRDSDQANAIVDAIELAGRSLPVLTLPGSALASAAAARGVTVVTEAFVDRAYRADGTLVPRSEPGAVLTAVEDVVAQAMQLVEDGRAQSLCIHGDTDGAVEKAAAVRHALTDAGYTLAPFTT